MRRHALIAFAVLAAALALLAAGCGDDEESASSADAWAEDFCATVQNWVDELELITEDLGDVSSLSSDTIEQAADDADAVTEDFLEELRDLGGPDTESGDAVEQEVEELSDSVEAEREEIRAAVDDISGLGDIAQAVGAVGASVAEMSAALQQTLEAINDADVEGEVRTALEDAESCDELRSES